MRHVPMSVCAVALAATTVYAQVPIQDNARIFFVGNSYVGTSGGLHEYVRRMFAAATPSLAVTTQASVSWGEDVEVMWNTSGAPETIRTGNWDIVVLQGYWSGIDYPAGTLDTLYKYATRFDSLATAHGAQLVLMMPWTGNPLASWMSASKFHNDMVAFQTNYTNLGQHLGVPVVPCSHAWHNLTDTLPPGVTARDYLYGDDLHQNNLASYLNSWMFYAILTRQSPVGLDYHYTDVTNVTYDAALRTYMQEKAWAVAQLYLPTAAGVPRWRTAPGAGAGQGPAGDAVGLSGRAAGRADPPQAGAAVGRLSLPRFR